jgi:hypothetical protein
MTTERTPEELARYDGLVPVEYREYPDDRDALLRRLEAAEQVCVLFGWTASPGNSPQDKACTQAWMDWHSSYGVGSPTPAWRARVNELAAERDRVRSVTLASLHLEVSDGRS